MNRYLRVLSLLVPCRGLWAYFWSATPSPTLRQSVLSAHNEEVGEGIHTLHYAALHARKPTEEEWIDVMGGFIAEGIYTELDIKYWVDTEATAPRFQYALLRGDHQYCHLMRMFAVLATNERTTENHFPDTAPLVARAREWLKRTQENKDTLEAVLFS